MFLLCLEEATPKIALYIYIGEKLLIVDNRKNNLQ